jgi:hypothetical protein
VSYVKLSSDARLIMMIAKIMDELEWLSVVRVQVYVVYSGERAHV